jgi:putative flippase GtrA
MIIDINNIKKHARKIRFLFVGALASVVYFISLYLLYEILKIGHNAAISTAYFFSIFTHFSGNKFFVFEEKEITKLKVQLTQYILLAFAAYLLNLSIINLLLYLHFNLYIAAAIATFALMIVSYLSMSRVIFISD